MTYKPVIQVDFDGTLTQYSGWKGVVDISDPPAFCTKTERPVRDILWEYIMAGHRVVVTSSRCSSALGRAMVQKWLEKHLFPKEIEVSAFKPPALVIIDDRGWPGWDGSWPTVDEIKAFQTWYNKKGGE